MTQEEFDAKIKEALAEVERGETFAMHDDESVEDFIARILE